MKWNICGAFRASNARSKRRSLYCKLGSGISATLALRAEGSERDSSKKSFKLAGIDCERERAGAEGLATAIPGKAGRRCTNPYRTTPPVNIT